MRGASPGTTATPAGLNTTRPLIGDSGPDGTCHAPRARSPTAGVCAIFIGSGHCHGLSAGPAGTELGDLSTPNLRNSLTPSSAESAFCVPRDNTGRLNGLSPPSFAICRPDNKYAGTLSHRQKGEISGPADRVENWVADRCCLKSAEPNAAQCRSMDADAAHIAARVRRERSFCDGPIVRGAARLGGCDREWWQAEAARRAAQGHRGAPLRRPAACPL